MYLNDNSKMRSVTIVDYLCCSQIWFLRLMVHSGDCTTFTPCQSYYVSMVMTCHWYCTTFASCYYLYKNCFVRLSSANFRYDHSINKGSAAVKVRFLSKSASFYDFTLNWILHVKLPLLKSDNWKGKADIFVIFKYYELRLARWIEQM